MQKNLIWFRSDLRIYDNTALHQACKSIQDQVIGLFISTPKQWKNHYVSPKKISFLYHHLITLKKELFKLNIILYHHISTDFLNSIKYLIFFCQKYKINTVFYNYQYEINERNRDYLMKRQLSEQGILVKGFHDSILLSHKKIQNKKNETYKVFSFFKKKIIQHLYYNLPNCFSIPIKRKPDKNILSNFVILNNITCNFNKNTFPIGEHNAIHRLKKFCTYNIDDYSLKRDFPFLDGTSMLSPYLSSGIISSRYCLQFFFKNTKCHIFKCFVYFFLG